MDKATIPLSIGRYYATINAGITMTKNKFFALLLAMFMLAFSACSTDGCGRDKDQFLARFEALLTEVDENRLPLGDPGWEARDDRFEQLVDVCYDQFAADMTGREKRRFWGKAMGYYKDRFGKAALDKWMGDRE